MPLGSLTTTYSLKVNTTLVPCTGTETEPTAGVTLLTTGGMVSLRPPVGACVVLAHDGWKTESTRSVIAGTKGKNLVRNFFIADRVYSKIRLRSRF